MIFWISFHLKRPTNTAEHSFQSHEDGPWTKYEDGPWGMLSNDLNYELNNLVKIMVIGDFLVIFWRLEK